MENGRKVSKAVIVTIGIFFALLSIAVVFIFQSLADRFSPTVSNVERFLRKGKLEEAFALSSKVPGETAVKAILRGRVFLALALKERKDDGWRRYGLDQSDWLKGQEVDSAVANFKKAISMDKKSADAYFWLGIVYKEKGWFNEAEDALNESLRLNPKRIETRLALGALYPLMDRPREAVKHLVYAYKIAPDNPDIAKNVARIYRFYLDKPESAMIWFNRYLNNAKPGDIDVNQAKIEMNELIARYPEFVPEEKQLWRQPRRIFIPRYR